MGSITRRERIDKRTGKSITQFRAYIRRQGFESQSMVCDTMREAKEWLRENEPTKALTKQGTGQTLAALIEQFVEAPPMRGTKFWKPVALDFWKRELGAMRVTDISRADINAGKAKLMAKPALRNTPNGPIITRQKIGAGTINRYLASLSSVFNYCVEHELIERHPMKSGQVKKLDEPNGRTRVLTDEEQAKLLEAAKRSEWPMLYLYVRMLMTSAARRSEVLNLKWDQIKLDESIAVLPTTKNGRPRALPLVTDVRKALAAAKKRSKSAYVFADPDDPDKVQNINTVWRTCREEAGLYRDRADPLDHFVLHSLRHGAVTRMLRGGANIAQVAAVSGHKTLAMLKKYEHLVAADSVELAERLLG